MKLEVVQFLDFQEGRSPSVSQQGGLPQVKQGAPVHIAWRTFYSGDLPDRNFKKRKNKTAVLSSFVKLSADSNAAPRVVSAVFEDPDDHHDFTPSAKGAGSPVILYQSTAQGETLVEVELMSKRRGSEDLDNLSEALQKAGNSPLLFFANGWINTLGKATKIASSILNTTSKDKVLFSTAFTLKATAPERVIKPIQLLAARKPNALLKNAKLGQANAAAGGYPILVNRSDDKPYEGDEPYVILEVDQAAQPNLEAFEHELRAGALLKDWTPKIGVDAMEVLKTIGALIKKNEN